ncbi:hypothetical protein SKAU_G00419320 [Synaphobranchus kaupii]|uniref:TGF-beta family profile domain-containing protein n=1 Tax=Synaphobranchus kaupii TaxID=118154 RepID=A0A9Q1E6D0_SYNKA|nr:hypothetical protein SKAU_G00419320 [Synaphobranchus kaupii]
MDANKKDRREEEEQHNLGPKEEGGLYVCRGRTLSEIERRGTNGSLSRSTRHANTVTSFVDQGRDSPSTASVQRYLFDFSSLSRTDELVGAELRVLRKRPPNLPQVLSRGGNLYRVLLYGCSEGASGRRPVLDARTVDVLDAESAKWEVFDVWATVRSQRRAQRGGRRRRAPCASKWRPSPRRPRRRPTRPRWAWGGGLAPPQERALLVAFSRTRRKENLFREIRDKMKSMGGVGFLDPPRSRQGRGTPPEETPAQEDPPCPAVPAELGEEVAEEEEGAGAGEEEEEGGGRRRTRCSRKPLHVNFKELGWDDWIIAPLDYEAYHCEGMCDFPLRSHLEPTNHAIIQTLMNSMDPDSTPPSCCVPSKLSPISILYIDSGNNVVYKQYEDMVVETCGCR